MSWIKNLIFQDEGEKAKKQEKPAVAETAVPVTTTPAPTPSVMTSGVDAKLVDLLDRRIQEANLPGPDYLELLQSSEQMKQFVPDESTRLKAAFNSIRGLDPRMTKEVVLASIDTYKQVVEAERGKFKLKLEKMRKELVSDKQAELEATNLRIEALKQEMQDLTQKQIELGSAIQKNTAETDAFEANSNSTIDLVVNRLDEDKVRLAQILQ